MQKRNLFVYCAKTATFPLAAYYTFALLKNIFLRQKNKRTKEQKDKASHDEAVLEIIDSQL